MIKRTSTTDNVQNMFNNILKKTEEYKDTLKEDVILEHLNETNVDNEHKNDKNFPCTVSLKKNFKDINGTDYTIKPPVTGKGTERTLVMGIIYKMSLPSGKIYCIISFKDEKGKEYHNVIVSCPITSNCISNSNNGCRVETITKKPVPTVPTGGSYKQKKNKQINYISSVTSDLDICE